jgi:D-alanyl-D-alanine carboxypeptidase/D-alanyl-D-alanine-endopeptidase (penicillin-binding protein 4)
MKHPICLLVIVCLIIAIADSPARAELNSEVRAALADKAFKKGEFGVAIIRLGEKPDDAKVVCAVNASVPRIPASNLKLVTTAAALELLGKDFKFCTTLLGRDGDLALVGDGDPSLGDAEMLRKVGWDVGTVFRNWADALKARGVSSIRNIYIDDSIFDEEFVHPNWPPEQEHKRYVAQVGGLNLNANCVDFFIKTTSFGQTVTYTTDPSTSYIQVANACQTGQKNAVWLSRQRGGNAVVLRGEIDVSNDEPISVTVHDAPMFAGTVLDEVFASAGIKVEGQVERDRTIRLQLAQATTLPATEAPKRWIPIAIHETPIAAVLARANKDSMNLYAEALCKRIGFAASGQSGSWQNGTAAVGAFLQTAGVPTAEFTLDDGCGLSKQNQISPNAIARVLAHLYGSANRDAFLASLSVAGSDGTLEKRFRDSDLRGRVFGKSGYVNGVSSLSGYVKARDGQWYAFSILMNGVSDIATCKQAQERIVEAIDDGAQAVSAVLHAPTKGD